METAIQRVRACLAEHQLTVQVLSETTATAAQAAATLGVEEDQIAKSILLRQGEELLLVVLRGGAKVDLPSLEQRFGKRLKLLPRDAVLTATGFPPGGVSPVGHEREIPVLMDEGLFQFDTVWVAAGSPFHVFGVSPQLLQELARAEVCRVA